VESRDGTTSELGDGRNYATSLHGCWLPYYSLSRVDSIVVSRVNPRDEHAGPTVRTQPLSLYGNRPCYSFIHGFEGDDAQLKGTARPTRARIKYDREKYQ
jgi:hypothetical protein